MYTQLTGLFVRISVPFLLVPKNYIQQLSKYTFVFLCFTEHESFSAFSTHSIANAKHILIYFESWNRVLEASDHLIIGLSESGCLASAGH